MRRMLPLAALTALALLAPAAAQEQPASPTPEAAPDALPADAQGLEPGVYVRFKTNRGVIIVKFEHDRVPHTTANMVGLIEGTIPWKDPASGETVTRPFYDGLNFHRVIDGFMIQGGCPLGQGTGGPGYQFSNEIATNDPSELPPGLKHDEPGILSMANAGPDTNGSQFFLTLAPAPWLDTKHTVFGHVVVGMDVLSAIGKTKTGERDTPLQPVVMEEVRVLRIGDAAKAWNPAKKTIPAAQGEPDPARVPNADAEEQARTQIKLICVQYAGCQRAWPEVTRTKEEATALAQQILAHARLPGADMDALAQRFSDLPPVVYQLGKGKTDPSFDPAFKLTAGQVSEPFETPFGIMIAEGQ